MLCMLLDMLDNDDDKAKFEKIYFTYEQIMFKIAKDILKDDARAEEAVGRAFEKIIGNLEKIVNPICPKTQGFVVIIVKRISYNMYKKKKPNFEIPIGESDDLLGSTNNNRNDQKRIELKDIFMRLPFNYREILLLKYSHGYVNEDLAKELKITEQNAQKRLTRAKCKLEKLLKDAEDIEHVNR